MQYVYIHHLYQLMQKSLKEEIEYLIETFESQRILILIAFLISFIIAFIFIWTPYINKISRDVKLSLFSFK